MLLKSIIDLPPKNDMKRTVNEPKGDIRKEQINSNGEPYHRVFTKPKLSSFKIFIKPINSLLD